MADRAVYKPCFPLLDRINTLLILYLTPPLPRTLSVSSEHTERKFLGRGSILEEAAQPSELVKKPMRGDFELHDR